MRRQLLALLLATMVLTSVPVTVTSVALGPAKEEQKSSVHTVQSDFNSGTLESGWTAHSDDMEWNSDPDNDGTNKGDGSYYKSANHSTDTYPHTGFIDVHEHVNDGKLNLSWQYWNGSTWKIDTTTNVTTTGNVTASLNNDSTKWRVVVQGIETGDSSDDRFDIDAEGFLWDVHQPQVDNNSMSPNSTTVETTTPTLSIQVNDSDFSSGGDSVTVEFWIDGSKDGTKTISSNQTVSHSASTLKGGEHDWAVNVSDDNGFDVESNTATFTVNASTINFHNVSSPDTKVMDDLNVTFYDSEGDAVATKTTSDGTVDMAGTGIQGEFTVGVRSDNYSTRYVTLSNDTTSKDAWLLPKSVESSNVTFQVTDRSGKFPEQNTTVEILRSFEFNGTVKYREVASDTVGAAGFKATLEDGIRYRLRIMNDEGDSKQFGPFVPSGDETVTLQPETFSVDINDSKSDVEFVAYQDDGTITAEWTDPEGNLTDINNLVIYEAGNKSNELVNTTVTVSGTQTSFTQSLSNSEQNTTWVVSWNASRNGEVVGGEQVVGRQQRSTAEQHVPEWLQQATVFVTVIMVGALFSKFNRATGAVVVSFIGGAFWWIGWMDPAAGAAIVVALVVAALYNVRGRAT